MAELEWNSVVLIASPNALENVAQVLGALRGAGYEASRILNLPATFTGEPTVVVAHLDSLMQNADPINVYIEFLHLYSRLKQASPLRLIVLAPPTDKRPGMFVGYGNLVDAYLTMPFSVQTLTGMVDQLAGETFTQQTRL